MEVFEFVVESRKGGAFFGEFLFEFCLGSLCVRVWELLSEFRARGEEDDDGLQ